MNTSDEEQEIHLETNYASPSLILHWGLVGGKNYKGGWRLPGKKSRPEGTVQYKNRALQTTFKLDLMCETLWILWAQERGWERVYGYLFERGRGVGHFEFCVER